MKQKILFLLKLAVSIGMMTYLIRKTDLSVLLEGLKQTNMFLFGLSLAISAFSLLIRAYKWQLLLNIHRAKLSLLSLYRIQFMSMFFNNFFLGTIGGDLFKIYVTTNQSDSKRSSVSSVVMDRATGFLMLCFVVFVSSCMMQLTNQLPMLRNELNIVMITTALLLLLLYPGNRILLKVGSLSIIEKYAILGKIRKELITIIMVHKDHISTVITCFILSVAYILTTTISMYVCCLAVDISVSFIHWLFIVPIVSFLIMMPISAHGIGVQEGAFFFYLEEIGIDPSSALLLALLPRIGMLIFSVIGGGLYIFKRREKACNILSEQPSQ